MNGSDIGGKSRNTWNWLDSHQVNAYRGTLTNVPWARNIGVPTMRLFTGIALLATCSQPPGAAQRSMQQRADSRKEYFLFNWINLNAERARYPCSLQDLRSVGHGSRDRWNALCKFVVLIQSTLTRFLLCFAHLEWFRKYALDSLS